MITVLDVLNKKNWFNDVYESLNHCKSMFVDTTIDMYMNKLLTGELALVKIDDVYVFFKFYNNGNKRTFFIDFCCSCEKSNNFYTFMRSINNVSSQLLEFINNVGCDKIEFMSYHNVHKKLYLQITEDLQLDTTVKSYFNINI